MSLKIVSWNIEGRLTRFSAHGRGTPEHIIHELRMHDADVVILPEASDGDTIDTSVHEAVKELGYEVYTALYKDKGVRHHGAEQNPTIKLLSRVPMANVTSVRYGDIRTLLYADVKDPSSGRLLRVFGIHLDDRSEEYRLAQVKDLCLEIEKSPLPVVVAGDFNAMHSSDGPAKLLRSPMVTMLTSLVPQGLLRSLLERVSEMASGTTLDYLESTSHVHDVNSRHNATSTPKLRGLSWLPSVRLIAIDHIYIDERLLPLDFHVAPDGGSDHRALSVTLELKD
jgi:endonuclease/exonuclease/phosphatase family metal-dependent hydrolase